MAVNVTFVPEQIVLALADILTNGVTVVVTNIVIGLEVTEEGTAQAIEDVMITVTTSLFTSVEFW